MQGRGLYLMADGDKSGEYYQHKPRMLFRCSKDADTPSQKRLFASSAIT